MVNKKYIREELYELSKPLQPERSKREDFVECKHKDDFKEYRDNKGYCYDPLCLYCKQRCGALNTIEI